jgi:hypothetical protein
MSSSENPFTPKFLKSKAMPDFLFQTNDVTGDAGDAEVDLFWGTVLDIL